MGADHQVQVPAQQLLLHLGDGAGVLPDADLGVDGGEILEPVDEEILDGAGHRQDIQVPGVHLPDGLGPPLQLAEGQIHVGQEHLPVGVQGDLPLPPLEQGDAQLLLQPGEIPAQAGLGDMQLLGGPGQIAVPRCRTEVAQLGELHTNPSFCA